MNIKRDNFSKVFSAVRPTEADAGYTVPTLWIDTAADQAYILTDVTSGVATWKNVTGASTTLDAQNSVLSIATASSAPPTETTGNRYLLSSTGTPHANWDGALNNDIVEFDGAYWVATTPTEGMIVEVEDVNTIYLYITSWTAWQNQALTTTSSPTFVNITASGNTPLNLTGTAVTKGVNFANATVDMSDADNTMLSYGTWNDEVDVGAHTAHFVPWQVHMHSTSASAFDIAAMRLRVDTDGDNTGAALQVLQLRSSIINDTASIGTMGAGLSIDAACNVDTGEVVVGGFSIAGAYKPTTGAPNKVTVLQACNWNTYAGTSVNYLIDAYQNGAGNTVDALLRGNVIAGTATVGAEIANTSGTLTTGLKFTGTIGTDISLQNGETISNTVNGAIALGGATSMKGPAAVTSFAGTVTAAASTSVTFSSAADAILCGYNATNPVLGATLISNALTRYIVSWTNATTAVVDSSVTWAGTVITSCQLPIATFVDSSGGVAGWISAGRNMVIFAPGYSDTAGLATILKFGRPDKADGQFQYRLDNTRGDLCLDGFSGGNWVEVIRWAVTARNVIIGGVVPGTSAVKMLYMGSGTDASDSPADAAGIVVKDKGAVAGKAAFHMRDEAGNNGPVAFGNLVITSHGATESATADTMYGNAHLVTGNYVVSLPTATVGYNTTFMATTAAAFSLDLLTGTDVFYLDGVALTAGYKVTSDASIRAEVQVRCLVTGFYEVTTVNGSFIDGGA